MRSLTLTRYFGKQFLVTAIAVFLGVFGLIALIDYLEMLRRTGDNPNASALLVATISFYRVPQITERIMPFCVLIAGMSCYLSLSRRLELVVARAAGLSAWQFTAPAVLAGLLLGVFATTVYNPVSAVMHERGKRLEDELFNTRQMGPQEYGSSGFWVRQRSNDGQSVINARTSREQGIQLGGVTVFVYDQGGKFRERIEATSATLEEGAWRLEGARVYATGAPPSDRAIHRVPTNLTPEQVRESFATPETVPFWQLPFYIQIAEHAGLVAAGYRLQYQKLLARPFLLAAMVLLAGAFSLRLFRFGGVQEMVLGGVTCGFLLYVLSKVTEDLCKAELMHPVTAAWLPVMVGGVSGVVALLFQEDG